MPPEEYNFAETLRSVLGESQKRQEELMAQRGELENQYNKILERTPEENTGGLKSMILPAIMGAIVGKGKDQKLGLGLVAAGTAGQSYWNNLKADEDNRKGLIVDKLKFNQLQSEKEMGLFNQLTNTGMDQQAALQKSYLTGQVPSSDPNSPYGIDLKAKTEAQKDIAGMRASIANPQLEPAVLEDLNRQRKLVGQEPLEGGISQKSISLLQRQEDLGLKKFGEVRRTQGMANNLIKNLKAGIGQLSPVANEYSYKKQADLSAAYEATTKINAEIAKLIQEKGLEWFGQASKERDNLYGRAMNIGRLNDQAGANFTVMEMALTASKLPDMGSFFGNIMATLRGYGDPETQLNVLRKSDQWNTDEFASKLVGYDGYLPGYAYSPEIVKRYGIPVDKQGRAINDNKGELAYNSLMEQTDLILGGGQGKTIGDVERGPATQTSSSMSTFERLKQKAQGLQ